MRASRLLLLVALTACAGTAWAQTNRRDPHIGYLYPGGGQQGSVFEVTVGGQFLRGATDVHVSGDGVRASIVKHYRPPRNISGDQRKELRRRLEQAMDKRLAELPERDRAPLLRALGRAGQAARKRKENAEKRKAAQKKNTQKKSAQVKDAKKKGAEDKDSAEKKPAELPAHPLLRNLEDKSLRELQHVANELLSFRNRRKRQLNSQISEMVLIKVTVDRRAAPGDREIRLGTQQGLTNPMCFQVGVLPEVREQEPNDPEAFAYLPKETPVNLPALLNGQIMPGDIDRFRFRAKQGQQLVIEAYARHLVPFLADAVPGWFQATLALYDAKGKEVAFADDYLFHPDPVLFYEVPEEGEYELEIRDSIYRGREDFVYRVAVGELPFITQAFPLGGRTGAKAVAAIDGWNLRRKGLWLDTDAGDESVRQIALNRNRRLSNEVTYAVDTLPERKESEPNDDVANAQEVGLPRIVNGRIERPGDVDVFAFEGRSGEEVVAQVQSRRLHSPLDSLLRLTDASGTVLEWNDDYVQKDGHLHTDMGFLTHHADSYLSAELPTSGTYYVHVADAQNHGGEAYGYRLRVAPPQPDFALRITPSSLSMIAGRMAPFTVHALRKDGFDGEIRVILKDAPPGFALSGGRIPKGRDRVRMTMTAPRQGLDAPVALQLEGRARIDATMVIRPVAPSDDVMQAFLWRHLVPAQELLVAVRKIKWVPPPVTLAGDGPVRVPVDGTAQVLFKTPRSQRLQGIELELSEPPEGVTLQDVQVVPEGLAFQLKAQGDAAKAGFADNLIVEAFKWYEVKQRGNRQGANKGNSKGNKQDQSKDKKDKAPPQKRRVSLGILPAVPFVVVQR